MAPLKFEAVYSAIPFVDDASESSAVDIGSFA
jgi:hypothetical protein